MNNLAKGISGLQLSATNGAATASRSPGRPPSNISMSIDSTTPPGTFPPMTVVKLSRSQVTVERFLAEGGSAHVYLVTMVGDAQQRAVLKRIACPDQTSLKELRQEVDVHKCVSGHKNIVRYIDSLIGPLQTGGFEVLILMEYCEGGHLVDFLNTRLDTRLTEDEVLRIFSDVCEAIAHLHERSTPIAHRDIKIENVLISGDGTCKLCDFGSCTTRTILPNTVMATQEIRDLEYEIGKVTTLQYRSPEMCDFYQKKGMCEKVDTWAMGILLFKLCFFTTPFEDGGILAILNAHYTIPKFPLYSSKLISLIQSLLEVDVLKRLNIFQTYAIVCDMRHTVYDLKTPPLPSKADHHLQMDDSSKAANRSSKSINSAGATSGLQTHVNGVIVSGVTPMRRGRPKANTYDSVADAPSPFQSSGDLLSFPPNISASSVSPMAIPIHSSPFDSPKSTQPTSSQHSSGTSVTTAIGTSQGTNNPGHIVSQPFPNDIFSSFSDGFSASRVQFSTSNREYSHSRGHSLNDSHIPPAKSTSYIVGLEGRDPFTPISQSQQPTVQQESSFWNRHSRHIPPMPPGTLPSESSILRSTSNLHSRPISWGGPMTSSHSYQQHSNDAFSTSPLSVPIAGASPSVTYAASSRPSSTGEWPALMYSDNNSPPIEQHHLSMQPGNSAPQRQMPNVSLSQLASMPSFHMIKPLSASAQQAFSPLTTSFIPTDSEWNNPSLVPQPPAKPPRANRMSIQNLNQSQLLDHLPDTLESSGALEWPISSPAPSFEHARDLSVSTTSKPSSIDMFGQPAMTPLLPATPSWQPLVPTPITSDPKRQSLSDRQ
ncbi:hypothetical protein BASA50_002056 [Batrachochytrium salamandrivorans]|uniref:non-specific serine/threonine protein kinase n=1 Tax=Batrachochytrium salamandrivorans TaxID=1357716 RepID=A0ABQ8FM98_9FUNG|nr:hypothetical protein BASA50_002056 [Batrachochytrium salamandrivorans]